MKVICIDTKPRGNEWGGRFLKEGNIYTVLKTVTGVNRDFELLDCYLLKECDEWVFDKNRFIPLSSIDETTFERNYKTETV